MNGSDGSVWLIYIVHITCLRCQFMVKIANEKKNKQEDENSSDFQFNFVNRWLEAYRTYSLLKYPINEIEQSFRLSDFYHYLKLNSQLTESPENSRPNIDALESQSLRDTAAVE